MMFTTPGGTMSLMISPSFRAVRGVVGAGFTMTVFPASSAAGTLKAIRIIGKFQGMMQPTTPRGLRRTSIREVASSATTRASRFRLAK